MHSPLWRGALPFVAGIPILVGLSFLFIQTRAGHMARHTDVVALILKLESIDGRIQREVLVCRVQETPDYTTLTSLQQDREKMIEQLSLALPPGGLAAPVRTLRSGVDSNASRAIWGGGGELCGSRRSQPPPLRR